MSRINLAIYRMEKAKEILIEAKDNLAQKHYGLSVNRSYYWPSLPKPFYPTHSRGSTAQSPGSSPFPQKPPFLYSPTFYAA